MKHVLSILAFMVISTSASAMGMIGVGYGQEKLEKFTVDLFQVTVGKRFDNGVIVTGTMMTGIPKIPRYMKENRPELGVGYSTRRGNFLPYASVFGGQRLIAGRDTVNYYGFKLGSKYKLSESFYLDAYYRFRDTNDAEWQSNLYAAGVGYNLSKSTSVQVNYGYLNGDYTSTQVGAFLITRF